MELKRNLGTVTGRELACIHMWNLTLGSVHEGTFIYSLLGACAWIVRIHEKHLPLRSCTHILIKVTSETYCPGERPSLVKLAPFDKSLEHKPVSEPEHFSPYPVSVWLISRFVDQSGGTNRYEERLRLFKRLKIRFYLSLCELCQIVHPCWFVCARAGGSVWSQLFLCLLHC